ncbi:MAG: CRISPR-associated endonuclease Cas1 [Haliscomenobacter sp.]|uniref:CRISPR-associated endonuclease Cas1 n=1 Tax=Haliscomenobacter sp. TaxID=2717303 RepID=UPI0029B9BE40|nr:CRISPR-associated endonuclease Cas1 [Haliscomenobacter sp.]MDX2072061.1 CRISPR-associated endonuclease Cas1 [Haliscomenobacter sp.]
MQMILNTTGLALKVEKGVFLVSTGDERRLISPESLHSIAITSPCLLSSAAIELAADAGIPIYFYDDTGDARSCLRSPYFDSLATLRRKQVYFSDDLAGSCWVLEQFRHKTQHQLQNLTYLQDRRGSQEGALQTAILALQEGLLTLNTHQQIPSSTWSAGLMGWEGSQARAYWQAVAAALPAAWTFKSRTRRPAQDAFNALLNYFYGFLYGIVEQGIFAAGLDPHLGILHVDDYDRPTLSYDLIEAFRPWVDRFILELVLSDQVEQGYFEPRSSGIFLNSNGKRFLIPQFNEWMKQAVRWQERQMSREAQIFRAAAMLAKHIQETVQRPDPAAAP